MRRIILPVIFLVASVRAQAQHAFTNNGDLQIHTNGSLAAFGNFSNGATGALVNNGVLYVRGNIINDQASMSAGVGTLHLDGSTAQSVGGAQSLNVFNFITNNTSGITLNNDLSVAGAHTFTAGVISSPSFYLRYENGSSHSGSSDNAHVNGWVRKTGASNFVFPVGNAAYLREIAVSSLSVSSVFNVNYAGATTNTGNVASPLVTVDPNEYWWVNQVSGGTAQIAMNWNNGKVPFPDYPLASIRVANYMGSLWTNQGGNAVGNVTTSGSITSSPVSVFGAFTFGSLNFTLPLTFIHVTALRHQGSTMVQWKTEDEFNVDHYEVERNDNAVRGFQMIGSVTAKNGLMNQYEVVDRLPLEGSAYYRIRSVDIDGAKSYSKVVSVSERVIRSGMAVINNPARFSISLSLTAVADGWYNYSLIDGGGKSIQAGRFLIEGQHSIGIPLSVKVIPGLYVLQVKNGVFVFSDKVVVQ